MAKKISQLEAAVDVTSSDLMQIVDVEDGDMAPSGTNKKVAAGLLANELVKIASVTATGTTVPRPIMDRFADIINVKDFGAVGDGVTDDTKAFQMAADIGGATFIPAGIYILTSININKSITWYGEGDSSVIKRKANTDTQSPSASTAIMVKLVSHNFTYTFRDLLFDGNEEAQIPYQPYGSLLGLTNVTGSASARLSIVVDNCTFKDSTYSCIRMDGDTASNGYEELTVTNCRFVNGRSGLAQGNPNVTSASGYGPDYITLTDKVYASITDSSFVFNKELASGEFSRTAVRITFSTNTNNSDGARANISGNYFYRCGRGERIGPQRPGNDVGVIDAYARGRELRITNNLFENSEGTPVRGKTNCDMVYIAGNISDTSSSNPAINIGPNSYVQQIGRIIITGNLIRQASGYAIGVVGNAGVIGGSDDVNNGENIQDYVKDVIISNNTIEGVNLWGMQDNPVTGDGIFVRNFQNVIVSGNILGGVDGRGIVFRGQSGTEEPSSSHLTVIGNRVEAAVGSSYQVIDGFVGTAIFEANSSRDSSSSAYFLQATNGAGANLIFNGNSSDNSVDYGVLCRYWSNVLASGNQMTAVSGLSRGFYFQDTTVTTKLTANHTNATTPIFGPGLPSVQDFANTWNPRVQYRSTVPSTNTWSQGDIVYNSSPSASGNIGWVCVTAGTPGTWKTFGTISA